MRQCLRRNVGGWNLPQFCFKSLVWQFHHFWYILLVDPNTETEGTQLWPSFHLYLILLSSLSLLFILPTIGLKVNIMLSRSVSFQK